jgi:hypothetical protein
VRVTARGSTSGLFGPTLKALTFLLALCVGIICASAGYGLLKMLLDGMSRGASIGISEFVTHSGLTIVFLGVAGMSAYVAKTSYW